MNWSNRQVRQHIHLKQQKIKIIRRLLNLVFPSWRKYNRKLDKIVYDKDVKLSALKNALKHRQLFRLYFEIKFGIDFFHESK